MLDKAVAYNCAMGEFVALITLTPTERSGSAFRTAPLEFVGIHYIAEEHVIIDELSLWIAPKKNSQPQE